jgi:putative transposase
MKLARSTYYYRSRRAAAREKALRERIVAVCDEFPRYGYRRVTYQLRAEGMSINHKTVARIMRQNGLQVRLNATNPSTVRPGISAPNPSSLSNP